MQQVINGICNQKSNSKQAIYRNSGLILGHFLDSVSERNFITLAKKCQINEKYSSIVIKDLLAKHFSSNDKQKFIVLLDILNTIGYIAYHKPL